MLKALIRRLVFILFSQWTRGWTLNRCIEHPQTSRGYFNAGLPYPYLRPLLRETGGIWEAGRYMHGGAERTRVAAATQRAGVYLMRSGSTSMQFFDVRSQTPTGTHPRCYLDMAAARAAAIAASGPSLAPTRERTAGHWAPPAELLPFDKAPCGAAHARPAGRLPVPEQASKELPLGPIIFCIRRDKSRAERHLQVMPVRDCLHGLGRLLHLQGLVKDRGRRKVQKKRAGTQERGNQEDAFHARVQQLQQQYEPQTGRTPSQKGRRP